MPWEIVKDENVCSISEPFAVKKISDGKLAGCHSTKEKAVAQQRALYAALRKEGHMSEYFLAPVEHLFGDTPLTTEENIRWVQAFPYDTWDHPVYGKTTVTPEIAQQYVRNFKDNVRGHDIAINYDHGTDSNKGNKAAGWIRDMEARADGLFFKVEFNPPAVEEIRNGEWRYFSTEEFQEWEHPHTAKKYQYVVAGGALTNKPWVKGMLPINFSEVLTEAELKEAKQEFTEWSELYLKELPDANFLLVKEGERFLPYKDKSGKVDLAHLNRAIVRIPQMAALSESEKSKLQSRAKTILAGANKMSELVEANPSLKDLYKAVSDAGLTVIDESKEWEHSEPGTGTPPAPKTDGDGHDDKDREGGWRRPDLPSNYPDTLKTNGGGKVALELTAQEEFELRNLLGIDANGDVLPAAKTMFGELDDLRKLRDRQDQEAKFAEQYPEMWAQHNELMKENRTHAAKTFSESCAKVKKAHGMGLKDTRLGFSENTKNILADTHVKFANREGTVEDFEAAIKAVVNGGLVEFGEIGTTNGKEELPEIDTSTAEGVAASRRLFGEIVAKIQKDAPDKSYEQCFAEAQEKHPDIYEAYQVALPA